MQREIDKITTDKNEEFSWLKDHSEKILTQIKKLKKDKKSLENKVQQLNEKEASNVGIQVDEKTTKIDPVSNTTQGKDKLVEVKMYSVVAVPTTKDSCEDLDINHSTSITKGNQVLQINQENDTNNIRENQITRIPYQHPNHKSRQLNQAMYLEQKQQTDVSKNINVSAIHSCDNNSSQVSSHHKIPQKIDLGWSDPFLVRHFCLSLKG